MKIVQVLAMSIFTAQTFGCIDGSVQMSECWHLDQIVKQIRAERVHLLLVFAARVSVVGRRPARVPDTTFITLLSDRSFQHTFFSLRKSHILGRNEVEYSS